MRQGTAHARPSLAPAARNNARSHRPPEAGNGARKLNIHLKGGKRLKMEEVKKGQRRAVDGKLGTIMDSHLSGGHREDRTAWIELLGPIRMELIG